MILNAQVMKEYEDWLDESIGEAARQEIAREVSPIYEAMFMGYMEAQLNGGK